MSERLGSAIRGGFGFKEIMPPLEKTVDAILAVQGNNDLGLVASSAPGTDTVAAYVAKRLRIETYECTPNLWFEHSFVRAYNETITRIITPYAKHEGVIIIVDECAVRPYANHVLQSLYGERMRRREIPYISDRQALMIDAGTGICKKLPEAVEVPGDEPEQGEEEDLFFQEEDPFLHRI